MAAKTPSEFGMRHPTVVPANFDSDAVPSESGDTDADASDAGSGETSDAADE